MLDGSLIDEADFPRPITQRSAKMGGCQQNADKGLEPMVLLLFRVVFCFVVWLWKTAETGETKEQWNPTPSRRFMGTDARSQVFRFIPGLRL